MGSLVYSDKASCEAAPHILFGRVFDIGVERSTSAVKGRAILFIEKLDAKKKWRLSLRSNKPVTISNDALHKSVGFARRTIEHFNQFKVVGAVQR